MTKLNRYLFESMVKDPSTPGEYLIKGCTNISYVEIEGPVDQVISHLQDLITDVVNPVLFNELEYGYYDSTTVRTYITGDRRATDEEVDAYLVWKKEEDRKKQEATKNRKEKEAKEAVARKAKEDAEALARAKKAFPDQFK
jgi:hypothetical protein